MTAEAWAFNDSPRPLHSGSDADFAHGCASVLDKLDLANGASNINT